MSKFYYLASPFSNKDKELEVLRAKQVTLASAHLLIKGIHHYSPVVYSSSIVRLDEFKDLDGTWNFWGDFCLAIISKLDGFIILTLDGWEKSVGVAAELELAKKLNIPIFYKSLDQMIFGDVEDLR